MVPIVVALIGGVQLVVVAWIAGRQAQVKRALDDFNGQVAAKLDAVHADVREGLALDVHDPSI